MTRSAVAWSTALLGSGAALWALHAIASGSLSVAAILALILGLGGAAAVVMLIAVNHLFALPALWKPSYITSDDHGLAASSWLGTSTATWSEVIAYARYDILAHVLLYTASGKVIAINTSGYRREAVDELCLHISDRAELQVEERTAWRRVLFVGSYSGRLRSGYRLLASDQVVASPPGPLQAGKPHFALGASNEPDEIRGSDVADRIQETAPGP